MADSTKSKLRILSLSVGLHLPVTAADDFLSRRNLTDFDLVLIDLAGAIKGYHGNGYDYGVHRSGRHRLTFNHVEGHAYLQRYTEMTERITDFVNRGGFCVLFARKLPTLSVIPLRDLGRNDDYDMNSFLSYMKGELIEAEGNNVEWSAEEPWRSFGANTTLCWQYNAYLKGGDLTPVANVKGHGDQVVAAHVGTKANGHVVVLPVIENHKLKPELVFGAILKLYEQLRSSPAAPAMPDWTSQFLVHKEADVLQGLDDTGAGLKALYKKQKAQRAELVELQRLKLLMCGSDSALEAAVDSALTELGMTVVPGKKKRADRTGAWNGRNVAIEVQGVKRGAAEDHVRSLVIWTQELAIEKGGAEPKGLLVVNTFREEPPSARPTLNSWPGKTLDICKQQGFCAITGLQLLGMVLEGRRSPDQKSALLQRLMDTVGAFEGYADWASFLTEKK